MRRRSCQCLSCLLNFSFGNAVESDEEVLDDDDRGEVDKGYKFVINENKLTYTRVKVPKKIYFTNGSVLYCKSYPIPTLAKLALDRYNSIEATNYKYVGLIKDYAFPGAAFNYTIRFQAHLPNQQPVNFQAVVIEPRANSANEVVVHVVFVHPLP